MVLTEEQQRAINIIIDRYKSHEKYTVISGWAGTGKAQPNNTLIPTPNGYVELGKLKIGDVIFDRKGKETKITGVFPQGLKENFKVTLGDGRVTYCNDEHIWTYYTSRGNLKSKTLKQMIQEGLEYSNKKQGYKFHIPVCIDPIEYSEKEVSIDPYVVGCFLGDGCCKERRLTISSTDEELVAEIGKIINAKYKKNSDYNYSWNFIKNDDLLPISINTVDFFKDYHTELCCCASEKRIPKEYKYNSIDNRLKLLQGLMDTDGSINSKDGNRYNVRYTSISLTLIKDVQEILYSLGYNSSISYDRREDKYTNGICYNLNINIPNEEKYKLFRLFRKKEIALEAKNFHKRRNYFKTPIVSVEKMTDKVEMTCIMVDNEEHLYLTNDFIVTHNTTCVKYAVEAIASECNINPNTDVGYACFTGKACQVLIDKGNKNATTLHKLLYKYIPLADGTFMRTAKDFLEYKIVIVDEVSMASKELIDELFTYPIYVICLGDDFQLPPIDEESNNHLLDNPHARLTEILRQEKGNSIIELSTLIREGKDYRNYQGADAFVIGRNSNIDFYLNKVDITLCGKNNTRIDLNKRIRELKGKKGFLDENEILINNHNDWDKISDLGNAFTNGVIGTFNNSFENFAWLPKYIGVKGNKLETISGKFQTDTGDNFGNIEIDKKFLISGVPTLTPKQKFMLDRCKVFKGKPPYELTYGYAITVHKAQGSQWNKVFIQEEWMKNDTDIKHRRWLYTAVTRAIDKCVILRG